MSLHVTRKSLKFSLFDTKSRELLSKIVETSFSFHLAFSAVNVFLFQRQMFATLALYQKTLNALRAKR